MIIYRHDTTLRLYADVSADREIEAYIAIHNIIDELNQVCANKVSRCVSRGDVERAIESRQLPFELKWKILDEEGEELDKSLMNP